jgi:TrpR-related protein YerC/YecD
MTKVSRVLIEPRRLQEIFSTLWESLFLLKDEEQKEFFQELLTESEVLMLAKRIQIAKMLLAGHDYRTIESYVRIGTPTIARVNHVLRSSNQMKKVVGRLIVLEEEAKNEIGKPYSTEIKTATGTLLKQGIKLGATLLVDKEKEKIIKRKIKGRI